jgi:hypothetical protein
MFLNGERSALAASRQRFALKFTFLFFTERNEVRNYCATLQTFLLENFGKNILIAAYAVSHVLQ